MSHPRDRRDRPTPGLNPPFHALVRYSFKENDPGLLELAKAIRAQAPTMKGWVLIIFDDVGFQTLGDGEIPSLRLLDDALERTRIDAIAHGKIGAPQERKK